MLSLNLPEYKVKLKKEEGKTYIFDILRRKYLVVTPEEWVRQHFVHMLTEHLGYPEGRLANEIKIDLNGTCKRCDTVLFDKELSPLMIIEYKRPSIKITQKVFDQITRYNMVLKVKYLIVSNGIEHYCCKIDYEKKCYHFLNHIPRYDEL